MIKSDKTNLFITKAIKIHNDKYDYSKVNYINAKTKIIITCKYHGDFEQTPSNHLSNFNCQKCANNLKLNTSKLLMKGKFKIYLYVKIMNMLITFNLLFCSNLNWTS
jgi:hypothetical protein